MSPKISVIMPVFNNEKYLLSAIESILNQSFTDFEFIIVDDCIESKFSIVLLNEFCARDKRIIIFKNPKREGQSKSLNHAIAVTKGKYIAIQDSDDISLEKRLERELNFLENNKEYNLVGTRWEYIDDQGQRVNVKFPPFAHTYTQIQHAIIRFNPFCHPTIMFHKNILTKIGLYNENFLFALDYEFLIRVCKHYKMFNLNEVLLLKRIHSEAASIKRRKIQKWYDVKAKIFAKEYLNLPNSYYLFIIKFFLAEVILPTWCMKIYYNIRDYFRTWVGTL